MLPACAAQRAEQAAQGSKHRQEHTGHLVVHQGMPGKASALLLAPLVMYLQLHQLARAGDVSPTALRQW